MYIAQAYKTLHEGWRYLIGAIIIFVTWQVVGALPLGLTILVKALKTGESYTTIAQMSEALGSNLFLFLMLLSFVFGLLGVFFSSRLMHKQPLLELTTARKKIDWKRFWFIFILWGVISVGMVLLDYFFFAPEDYMLNFKLKPFIILCIIAIIFIPLQTSFEEYLFRGYLMQGLGVMAKNKWVPLLITSVGFGLLHIANPEVDKLGYVIMIYYIGTGLFLGIITLMDEGLELALGFHAANNLFTALLVTADWTAFQTHSVLKDISDPSEMVLVEILIPVFVVFPILLLILSKVYQWTHWKDKLLGAVEPPKIQDDIITEIGRDNRL